jgi:hypothetical protein
MRGSQPQLDHGSCQPPVLQIIGTSVGEPLQALQCLRDGSLYEIVARLHRRPGRWWEDRARVNAGGKAMEMLSSRPKALLNRGNRKRGQISKGSETEHLEGESQPGIHIRKGCDGKIGEKGGLLSLPNDRDAFAAIRKGGKLSRYPIRCDADPGSDAGLLSHQSLDRARGSQVIAPEPAASLQIADGLPHLQRLDERCEGLQGAAHALPDRVVQGKVGLQEESIRALMACLREGHTRPHAMLLCCNVGLADLTTLPRQTAKNQGLGTKLRAAALFSSDPETGNHAKMQNH